MNHEVGMDSHMATIRRDDLAVSQHKGSARFGLYHEMIRPDLDFDDPRALASAEASRGSHEDDATGGEAISRHPAILTIATAVGSSGDEFTDAGQSESHDLHVHQGGGAAS